MTVVETLLVFVVAPLAIIGLLAALTLVPGARKRPRYKPGQPWEHPPLWFEPHPEHGPQTTDDHGEDAQAIGSSLFQDPPRQSGSGRAALPSGYGAASDGSQRAHGATAAGSHGATAAGSHATGQGPVPVPAGPLGGARGTW